MSQGYEMQKHRADILKGALDLAHERLDAARTRVAELDDLVKDWIDTAQQQSKLKDTAEARVVELERQLERRRLNDSHTPYCGGLDA